MLNNLTNFFNLIRGRKIKTTPDGSDLIPLGTRDPRYDGSYQPTAITVDDFVASLPPAGVESVTGLNTDNTDPLNPIVEISVDGITITGDGTPGNPLVAAGGGGAVNYANVIFVDGTNGNDGTGAINDFTKPMATIAGAIILASSLSSSFNNRALIYIRKGYYFVGTGVLYDYVDFYSEVGVVIQGGFGRLSDQSSPSAVNVNFMGYADIVNCDLFITKASTINVQVNSITNENAVLLSIPVSGTANITLEATKLYSQGLGTNYGITIRNSSNVTVNIKEKYSCPYSLFDIRNHSGRVVVNAPKLTLTDGNIYGYGGNFKQVVIIRANLGGEMIINGDLVNEEILSYVGSNAGIISRVQDSWGTLRINGSIYSGNMFGVNAQGSSGASRTIINGDVRTNNLVAYVASNSNVVFRNGTLMNWNTNVGSEGYPVMSMGGSGSVWVENCHLHSLGLGATYPNIAAFWKDTTTATLNVYNSVHSGADTPGFFIRNSVAGQPVNNVRILNCRATKPLDTNITDLLTPTGFTQDANVQSINFI